ncbi:hypothetical protein BHE74_00018544 [Ensete ventricosum]|uniref:Uncharacterized protein n=1 Tax=Ensete ventricosum TaxID=4639 RepID=A0A426YN96_ENSVE|nr:hypothetical protein B296_00028032 [Ensete ventricosum]RWW73576.1 hypothetical protein BHE74_00018544 [Ensete ventricosum]RZS20536.1 hypothetical protein BHM03_00053063 [Ensete ventricosum]
MPELSPYPCNRVIKSIALGTLIYPLLEIRDPLQIGKSCQEHEERDSGRLFSGEIKVRKKQFDTTGKKLRGKKESFHSNSLAGLD